MLVIDFAFKQKVHDFFMNKVIEKINAINTQLKDLKQMGANETKSTAGDKHETALAMIQIEESNNRIQLNEALIDLAILQKINLQILSNKIVLGSLLNANDLFYYICIGLGKIVIEEKSIIALSPFSPLGKQLMGKTINDIINFNTKQIIIEGIL